MNIDKIALKNEIETIIKDKTLSYLSYYIDDKRSELGWYFDKFINEIFDVKIYNLYNPMDAAYKLMFEHIIKPK